MDFTKVKFCKAVLCSFVAGALAFSCEEFDDSSIWDKLNEHEARIEAVEKACTELNTNVAALQAIVNALQGKDYVTAVTPTADGYTISFDKGETVTIKNGKDGANGKDGVNGADGKTPVVSVKADTDGVLYWTIDGEWLTDGTGAKVKAVATDGEAGVTPEFKVEEEYWYVSYDKGANWTKLGKASGAAGDSFFQSVVPSETEVVFTLADGTTFTLPLASDKLGITFGVDGEVMVSVAEPRTLTYSVQNGSEATIVAFSMTNSNFVVEQTETSTTEGEFTISASNIGDKANLIVIVNDGEKSIVKVVKLLAVEKLAKWYEVANNANYTLAPVVGKDYKNNSSEVTVTESHTMTFSFSEDLTSCTITNADACYAQNGSDVLTLEGTVDLAARTVTVAANSYGTYAQTMSDYKITISNSSQTYQYTFSADGSSVVVKSYMIDIKQGFNYLWSIIYPDMTYNYSGSAESGSGSGSDSNSVLGTDYMENGVKMGVVIDDDFSWTSNPDKKYQLILYKEIPSLATCTKYSTSYNLDIKSYSCTTSKTCYETTQAFKAKATEMTDATYPIVEFVNGLGEDWFIAGENPDNHQGMSIAEFIDGKYSEYVSAICPTIKDEYVLVPFTTSTADWSGKAKYVCAYQSSNQNGKFNQSRWLDELNRVIAVKLIEK